MATNYFVTDNSTKRIKSVPILKKHNMSDRGSSPAMEVDYNGTEKQFVFSNEQRNDWSTAKQLDLTVKDGFFGFDVIENIALQ